MTSGSESIPRESQKENKAAVCDGDEEKGEADGTHLVYRQQSSFG
jgi:hypothetical protein